MTRSRRTVKGTLTVAAATPGQHALQREVAAARPRPTDPSAAFTFRTFDQLVDATLTQDRLIAMRSAFFGGLALLLAGVGLYGIVACAVRARRTEIGIRMALGAAPAGNGEGDPSGRGPFTREGARRQPSPEPDVLMSVTFRDYLDWADRGRVEGHPQDSSVLSPGDAAVDDRTLDPELEVLHAVSEGPAVPGLEHRLVGGRTTASREPREVEPLERADLEVDRAGDVDRCVSSVWP